MAERITKYSVVHLSLIFKHAFTVNGMKNYNTAQQFSLQNVYMIDDTVDWPTARRFLM